MDKFRIDLKGKNASSLITPSRTPRKRKRNTLTSVSWDDPMGDMACHGTPTRSFHR